MGTVLYFTPTYIKIRDNSKSQWMLEIYGARYVQRKSNGHIGINLVVEKKETSSKFLRNMNP